MYHEVRLQGSGGQGVVTAGHIIGEAASLHEHKEAILTEDYGPYMRGGWSRADLIISDKPIDYPLVIEPDILVAMSQEGVEDNWDHTSKDAIIIVESSCWDSRSLNGRKLFTVPALSIAEQLSSKLVMNIVMLGVLAAKTHVVGREAMESAITLRYPKAAELNLQAFARGFNDTSSHSP